MSQLGLIEQVLKEFNLLNSSNKNDTPALSKPLLKHEDAEPFSKEWSDWSLVGKLYYLAKNTRLDIEFAVHQCERHQINPRKSHANAIKHIFRYILRTKDNGITFTPTENSTDIIAYVDADFCGSFEKVNSEDPNECRSRSGYVRLYTGCTVL